MKYLSKLMIAGLVVSSFCSAVSHADTAAEKGLAAVNKFMDTFNTRDSKVWAASLAAKVEKFYGE